MNYHEYIPDYKSNLDQDNQWNIACKQEFYSLRSEIPESPPEKGMFYKHQEIVKRYMNICDNDRILAIHDTGTGKTGTAISVADYYIENKMVKKVIVLEPGLPTKTDFKNQILKLSNIQIDTDFFTDNESVRKAYITKELKNTYLIETYKTFTLDIERRNLSEEEIKNEFSDCIFVFDEAHRLRNQEQRDSFMTEEELENIYTVLWKITHLSERSKVIILTATPIVNDVNDFVPLINLLLPADKQLPSSWNYKNVNIEQLEPYFRGIISYVRGLDLGIKKKEIGNPISFVHNIEYSNDTTKIIPTIKKVENNKIISVREDAIQHKPNIYTKQIKSQIILHILEMKGIQLKSHIESKSGSNFRIKERQTSVAVFPDGKYTDSRKYIVEEDGEYRFTEYFFKLFPKTNKSIMLDNLRDLSCKYHDFIKREVFENNRLCFIYLEYVTGTGLIYFGLLLQLFGYELFDRPSVFRRIRNPDGTYRKVISSEFKKKKRYALLTNETKNIESILELMSSKENVDGEYIQFIAVSKLARDGINISNVTAAYLFTSEWNEAGRYQAVSRIIRNNSFDNIKKKYPNREINVEIFNAAAVENMSILKKENLDLDSLPVDLFIFMKAEEKDIYSRAKMRIMKQLAFDGFLNYLKNVKPTDIDYSKESDYSERFFKLWGARSDPFSGERRGIAGDQGPSYQDIDYQTYNLFYYQELIKNIISYYIILFLREFGSDTINNIESWLENVGMGNIKYRYIYDCVEWLQEKKIYIRNKEGQKKYVTRVGESVYLIKEYFDKKNIIPGISGSYITYRVELENEKRSQNNDISEELDMLDNMPKEKIFEYLKKGMDNEKRMKILEDSIVGYCEKGKYFKIIEIFDIYCIVIDEPNYLLNYTKNKLTDIIQKGKGKTQSSKASVRNIFEEYDDIDHNNVYKTYDLSEMSKDKIVIHYFDPASEEISYSVNSMFTKKDKMLRVYKDGKFKDSNSFETPVYNWFKLKKYKEKIGKYESMGIYGAVIYSRRGDFRVYINEESLGIVCGSMNFTNICKLLNEFMRIEGENVKEPVKFLTESGYDLLYVNMLTKEKRNNLAKLQKYIEEKKINKNTGCNLLKEKLKEAGRLFETI